MKVKIEVVSASEIYRVFVDTLEGFSTGLKPGVDLKKFIDKLFGIIMFWDREMIDYSTTIHNSYVIEIDNRETFRGVGVIPERYKEFLALLREASL